MGVGLSVYRQRNNQQNNQPSIYVNNIKSKSCKILKPPFQLIKRTLKLVQDPTNPKDYYLNFNYYADEPILITIFYVAKEIFEESTQLNKYFQVSIKDQITYCYKCIAGQNLEFPSRISVLNTQNFSEDQLTKVIDKQFPIIIKMETQSSQKQKMVMFTYGICELNEHNVYQYKLVRQKLEDDFKSFEITDIFGIDQTQFNKEWNAGMDGDKECTICFTEKIDTILLPCKHMCCCKTCSEAIKTETKKCPICRYEIEVCLTIDKSEGKNVFHSHVAEKLNNQINFSSQYVSNNSNFRNQNLLNEHNIYNQYHE